MIATFIRSWGLALCIVVLTPVVAFAHIDASHTSGLSAGFSHPFTGIDHLLAMVAIGLWAAQMGGRALWVVPSSFAGVMLIGAAFGMAGIAMPFVEQGILVSLLVLGVAIATALRLPVAVSAAVAGVFALFHGHAHGTEKLLEFGGLAYAAGFMIATVLLHASGVALGFAIDKLDIRVLMRVAGVAIAASGIYLAVA